MRVILIYVLIVVLYPWVGFCFENITGERKINPGLELVQNDYIDEYHRGTVLFEPKKSYNFWNDYVYEISNYSYHNVIIPDNTVVEKVNFSQKEPHTKAIIGKNLIFIECNLVNNEIDPTWTLINCNTSQVLKEVKDQRITENGFSAKTISIKVEKDGKFVEVDEYEEYEEIDNPGDNLDNI